MGNKNKNSMNDSSAATVGKEDKSKNSFACVCPDCGKDNKVASDRFHKGVRYFCIHCGAFLQKDKLANPRTADRAALKLARILENLQSVPHSRILWNDMIDKYVTDIEKIRALYALDDIKDNKRNDVAEKMETFLSACRTADFHIAFVGTIKTGKSTLINALLGKNYASMAVTPETAALTKFRSSSQDYVRVIFYNSKEWDKLWASVSSGVDTFIDEYKALEGDKHKAEWIDHEPVYTELENEAIRQELKKWSSSQSPEHYFVKEIEVGISNLGEDFPKQVVFVDTPGLSDPVAYRSDITRDYIKKANAVFVCIDAQKMYQQETETIAAVFSFSHKNKKKVHIIATHWDCFNNPDEDWKKQKAWLLKQLVGPAFFDDTKTADDNILPASAYIYNLCREYDSLEEAEKRRFRRRASMLFEDEESINIDDIEACLPFFMKRANIDYIRQVIKARVISNYKEMLQSELGYRYQEIRRDLQTTVREERKRSQELIEDAGLDVGKLQEKENQHRQDAAKVAEQGDELEYALSVVETAMRNNLETIINAIDGKKSERKNNTGLARKKGSWKKWVKETLR